MMPTSNEVSVIGATMMPPSAPSAAESAKLSMSTISMRMPTRRAARRLLAVASIALPQRVRSKNHHMSATAAAATPMTQRLCGASAAPAIMIGASPEKGGRACVAVPRHIWMAPRSTSDTPRVMMTRVTTSASRAGRMASRSTATPTAATRRMAAGSAIHAGSPISSRKTASIPPSMRNSPWAKLMTLLAL